MRTLVTYQAEEGVCQLHRAEGEEEGEGVELCNSKLGDE